ncbi:MAG: hypothetical protein ACOYXW_01230 [Actinomycetota bacterium]
MIAFLNFLIRKNEMVEATAVALRTGCRKVLDAEDDWANVDIRTLDVDALIMRFRNKSRGNLADRSVSNYEQRFRSTVEMYRKWLDEDPTWRPSTRTRATNGAAKRTASAGTAKTDAAPFAEPTPEAPAAPPAAGMVTYPLPIRPGVQGRLVLPEDLTAKEAKRIANFVSALPFEEQRAITAGDNA